VIDDDAFVQYPFDNADFNTRALDGYKTFHCMGGIRCVTPATAISLNTSVVKRLRKIPRSKDIAALGHVPVVQFHRQTNTGLRSIVIKDVSDIQDYDNFQSLAISLKQDALWLLGNGLSNEKQAGWSGFMECAVALSKTYVKSKVMPLPFINLPATDSKSIYTALKLAADECRSRSDRFCFVTFDQPLYIIAVDIVAACGPTEELSSVVVRLGGFHLLMSFLGSIGSIMEGSGLEELWATAYAPKTVAHMISGHAYSRAVRAHSLTRLALALSLIKTYLTSIKS